MFAAIVLVAFLSTAAAFAPSSRFVTKSSALSMAFDGKAQAGVSGPFGFFDPLGLAPADQDGFSRFRESELKHGRIAMIAFLGKSFHNLCLLGAIIQ